MARALQIAHLLLLLAGIAAVSIWGVLGWRAWTLADELDSVLRPVPAMEQKANAELDEAHRLTLEAGLTAMEARKASALELKYLPKWDAGVSETLTSVNDTVTALRNTASVASQTMHGASLTLSTMNDSIAATKPLIEASTATVRHYDAAAPAVTATAANVRRMTADGARITRDAADEADKLAHPKKRSFWSKIGTGLEVTWKLGMLLR